MNWKEEYQAKLQPAAQAVKLVRDGDMVYTGTCTSIAYALEDALYERKAELNDVTLVSAFNMRQSPLYQESGDGLRAQTYFAGPAERAALKRQPGNYTSMHLSEMERWYEEFMSGGVAFLEVSPPDDHGYMSLGASGVTSHDYARIYASRVVVQVNRHVPYVYGRQNLIHVSQVDAIVEADMPLLQIPDAPIDEATKSISDFILEQIPDGATFQLGLGSLCTAIGFGLEKKNDLGVHTEMFTNSMMHLMELGVINNHRKNYIPDKSLAAFALGSQQLYEFIHRNPDLLFVPFTVSNNPYIIGKNDNMVSVNTAMAVDLFGQVYADNLAGNQQSGVGGQVDFVRGAQLSKGGKSFIALTSTMQKKGGARQSRIMATVPPATAVTTARSDVQYVVTEYGCVNLKSLTMADRAKALISLAHPDFRDELTEQAKQLGLF